MDSASEVLLAQILPLSYDDTINWCKTSKSNSAFCKSDYVWQQKAKYNFGYELLDNDLSVRECYMKEDYTRKMYKRFKRLCHQDRNSAINLFVIMVTDGDDYSTSVLVHVLKADKSMFDLDQSLVISSALRMHQNLFQNEKSVYLLNHILPKIWTNLSAEERILLIPLCSMIKKMRIVMNSMELFMMDMYSSDEGNDLFENVSSYASDMLD